MSDLLGDSPQRRLVRSPFNAGARSKATATHCVCVCVCVCVVHMHSAVFSAQQWRSRVKGGLRGCNAHRSTTSRPVGAGALEAAHRSARWPRARRHLRGAGTSRRRSRLELLALSRDTPDAATTSKDGCSRARGALSLCLCGVVFVLGFGYVAGSRPLHGLIGPRVDVVVPRIPVAPDVLTSTYVRTVKLAALPNRCTRSGGA